QLSVH
ncbi:hypothetical protein D031_3838B, partial [Vibrio parahaemolyticus VP-48]